MSSNIFQIPFLLVLSSAIVSAQDALQSFNLSSAECFTPVQGAGINMFMEWSAFDTTDQYCYDNHGAGYEAGQKFISCGGCMHYTCSSRPCNERDGSQFKTFWVLESIARQCCQDCQGKIYPNNRVVATKNLDGDCGMQEHAVCKTSPDSPVGTIEVSYTANNCCIDASEWSPAGTNFLEPETCSSRTCVSGRPAQWERKTEFQG